MTLREDGLIVRSEDFSLESWEVAQDRIKFLGYFARSFTNTIRLLRQHRAHQGGVPGKLHPECAFDVRRFLRALSVRAHYYYLSLTYFRSRIKGQTAMPPQFFVDFYGAEDHAAILALIYLYHRVEKRASKEEFSKMAKAIQESVDIGGLLGKKVSYLKFSEGILLAGVRQLALALCMDLNLQAFRVYRRGLIQNEAGFDQTLEIKSWGCSHVQVAALLLQSMGFGVEFAQAFKEAMITEPKKVLAGEANRLRLCALWTDALYFGIRPPVMAGEADLVLSAEALDELAFTAMKLRKTGSEHAWLIKSKDSITERLHPALFVEDADFDGADPLDDEDMDEEEDILGDESKGE